MRTANLKEWVGRTDDARVPPYVRLRVFEKYNGICYLSKIKIKIGDDWELEHIIALCNGGEHRESNFAPALVEPHKAKTRQDRATKAKNDSVRKKFLGIEGPKRKIQSAPFRKSAPQRTASRPLKRSIDVNQI
jgi:5-methylcytosine-specific restriction protein A